MKVVVIGAGMVGSAVIGELLAHGGISEIYLLDLDRDKAEGEILDYSHTTSYNYNPSANLKIGDYHHCKDADLIIMTAGPSIKKGETRIDLAGKNAEVMRGIMKNITRYTKDAIIIPVTNPVDIVTYVAAAEFDYPRNKIIGTGTIVDSARLMRIIGNKYNLDPKNVFAYMLGEHGTTSFAAWSISNICGYTLEDFIKVRGFHINLDKDDIEEDTKKIGMEVWRKKGYTNHGIAAGVGRIVKAISLDEKSILPVSVLLKGEYGIEGVALSVPCIVSEKGVEKLLEFPLAKEEMEKLESSAKSLQEVIRQI
ncbi:malate dehydrogenase (NAD) [Orenia metallireducens]|jgi:L-lactate dehydrogenase|uniref:L-lactate dehydrogenase n=1 Tax=Orenia metallireducens TaxID=1413210 RepID=A0A285GFM5_9FIRM|nr:L-lactate dehydrogenase [Orenia metallireducens]PRX19189.1 malate dehydrogenase (NAD) [Orenia metallireducens]SNY21306.1 malate dehydrogenase (NAD) [Orenia metallireducens]